MKEEEDDNEEEERRVGGQTIALLGVSLHLCVLLGSVGNKERGVPKHSLSCIYVIWLSHLSVCLYVS